ALAREQAVSRLPGDDAADTFIDVAFTQGGKLLLAVTQQGAVYLWNTADWSRQNKLTIDGYYCRGFSVSPDGSRAAITDQRSRIWVWDLAAGKLLGDDRPAHEAQVGAVALSPDGGLLATGSDGKDTHLWEARSGQHMRKLETSSQHVVFADAGKRLITSWTTAPQIRTWEIASGQEVSKWSSDEAVRFSVPAADLSHVVVVTDNQVQLRSYRIERLTYPDLKPAGRAER